MKQHQDLYGLDLKGPYSGAHKNHCCNYSIHAFSLGKSLYENEAQIVKILRISLEDHEAQFPKLSVSAVVKSIFRHYCVQNGEDGIQTRAYRISKEVQPIPSSLFQKKLRKCEEKSQAQFQEKLRKSRLRKNGVFLTKKTCIDVIITLTSQAWT